MKPLAKSKGRWVVAASAVVALAGSVAVGLLFVRANSTAGPGNLPARAHSTAQSDARADQLQSATWPVGEQREYSLREVSLAKAGDETLVDLKLEGLLRATRIDPASAAARATRLVLEVTPKTVSLRSSPESEKELRTALQEQVIVDISARGLVSAIGFADGDSAGPVQTLSRGLLRALSASLQLARPAAADQATWTATERDASGVYVASYERKSKTQVEKTKLRYEQASTPLNTGAKLNVVQSRTSLSLLPDTSSLSGLSQLVASDEHEVSGGTLLPRLSAKTEIRLTLSRKSALSADAVSKLRSAAEAVQLARVDDRTLDSKALLDQAKLAGTTYPDLLKALERDPSPSSIKGARARVYSQFAAQLRQNPENVADALEKIRSKNKLSGTLIDALGDAGTPQAQAALRDLLYDAGQTIETKHQIVLALAMGDYPTVETTDTLSQLMSDPKLGRQATFGLGTAAYHLRERSDLRSQLIVEELKDQLAEARDLVAIVDYLKALGNAADPASLGAIQPFLSHENSSVRAAAVDALRRIQGAVADQYLARALTNDAKAGVRKKAAEAMTYRGPSATLVYALIESLTSEVDRAVRIAAVRAALRWSSEAAPLRNALGAVATSDRDPKVRELAASAS